MTSAASIVLAGAELKQELKSCRGAVLICSLRYRPMKMENIASTAPGNIWTKDEFLILVRDTVANLLNVDRDGVFKAGEAEINSSFSFTILSLNRATFASGTASPRRSAVSSCAM